MNLQFDLLGGAPVLMETPKARNTDPATSHMAAARVNFAAQHQERIVRCLKAFGPLGKDGIGARTGLTGVAISRRLKELVTTGQIRKTGNTVASAAGRQEAEYEAV